MHLLRSFHVVNVRVNHDGHYAIRRSYYLEKKKYTKLIFLYYTVGRGYVIVIITTIIFRWRTAASIGRSINFKGVTFIFKSLQLFIRIVSITSFFIRMSIIIQSQLYTPKFTPNFCSKTIIRELKSVRKIILC